MKFFKKLDKGASNFFKKAPSQASNFFKKMDDNVDKAANFADNAISRVAPVTRQIGNYLEKYSGPVSQGLATAAAMTPYTAGFAPTILKAGESLTQGGKIMKDGSIKALELRNQLNEHRNTYHNYSNAIQNTIQNPLTGIQNFNQLQMQ